LSAGSGACLGDDLGGGRFWEMFGRLRAGYEKGMTYDVWFFMFRGSIHSLFVFLSVRWDER
jgi:hypothetical protein